MTTTHDPTNLTDADLIAQVARAATQERSATVPLIALLAELDARRLYLGEGCASLFTYYTQVLHLSEHAAYGRIEAARAARSYPIVLNLLAEGALTLTAIGLLRQHLTSENYQQLLGAVRHKTKREVEELIARVRPQPAAPSRVRRLPSSRPISAASPSLIEVTLDSSARAPVPDTSAPPEPTSPARRRSTMTPLAPDRYKVQFTVSAGTHAKLRQVQDLLRHTVPNGDPAEIFDRALTMLLEHLRRTKLAAADRPRAQQMSPSRRHIPAAVKREVWSRDGGRCAFVGTRGRCTETGLLEFHHVEPFAVAGASTTCNIQLRCRAHNSYEAELFFGTRETPLVRERQAAYSVRTESLVDCARGRSHSDLMSGPGAASDG